MMKTTLNMRCFDCEKRYDNAELKFILTVMSLNQRCFK
jgi:hypothetical protein